MRLCSILIGIFLSTIATNSIAATQCARVAGNMKVEKVTLGCLDIQGSADLNGTVVTGMLTLTGPLNTQQALLNGINSTGPVNLENTTVSGPVHFVGKVQATNTIFKNNIEIISNSISLNNTSTKEIKIKSSQDVIVELNNSTVDGNIVFVHKNGIVRNNHSKINGKVIGGKLEVALFKALSRDPGYIKIICGDNGASKKGGICNHLLIASV